MKKSNSTSYGANLTTRAIESYREKAGLDNEDVLMLRSFDTGSAELLKSKCGITVSIEMWSKIIQFGYPIAAFQLKDFPWELACLIEDRNKIMEMLIELLAKPALPEALTETELALLKMYLVVFVNSESRDFDSVSNRLSCSNIRPRMLKVQENY